MISNVIHSDVRATDQKNVEKCDKVTVNANKSVTLTNNAPHCSCIKAQSSVDIANIVQTVMDANTKKGKTIIRLEIEIANE